MQKVGEPQNFMFIAPVNTKRFYFYGYYFQAQEGLDGIVHRS